MSRESLLDYLLSRATGLPLIHASILVARPGRPFLTSPTLGTGNVVTRSLLAVIASGLFLPEATAEMPAARSNAVILWNGAALQAIRETVAGPTATARALAILYTCMFDAWA